ncbi:MAG: Origin recognition complex subunit 2 [Peltula sp. TS41687]|nr:MAG: Origin recognition complex subunit 2 [Peltula sp. TS41687]
MKRKLENRIRREGNQEEDDQTLDVGEQETPTKRRRGRPPGSSSKKNTTAQITHNGKKNQASVTTTTTTTPSKQRRGTALNTPTKSTGTPTRHATANGVVSNGDLSARKKSARTLMGHTVTGQSGDEDDLDEEEDILAEKIWNQEVEEEEDEEEEEEEEEEGDVDDDDDDNVEALLPSLDAERSETGGPSTSTTPSKRGRGRGPAAKGSVRKRRSATPPQDLPAHEEYFFQNRPGGNKTSTNTLASLSLLNHEEYYNLMRDHVDPHEPEREFLHDLHSRSFAQWRFEMTEGFSICLYGWGSKRKLMMDYAEWLHTKQCNEDDQSDEPQNNRAEIVVINGYVTNLSIKDVVNTLARAFFGPAHTHKLGGQPGDMVEKLLSLLNDEHQQQQVKPITLIIHSIDSPSLRRPPSTQTLLSRLASHDSIHLLASADHPSFPLLWDSSVRETFNFLFHDSTTFAPYDAAEFDVVESVHDLLGRSARQVAGKEGVGYVLKSLPENARSLYRVLVSEQLAGIEEGISRGGGERGGEEGVEYRVLYQKAVEEFICSSEVAFRTLLKEFHDHQMIASRKDVLGTEILWVPFRKEELEAVLDDLLG